MEPKFEGTKDQRELLENLDPEDPRLLEYLKNVSTAFDRQIPWLEGYDFKQARASILSVNENVAGGILTFDQCPEDEAILQAKEKLLGPGGIFASCLYIKDEFRGQGLWKNLLKAEIDKADAANTFVWGVVGDPGLLQLYQKYFNPEIHALDDSLYLVKFTKDNYLVIKNRDGKKL